MTRDLDSYRKELVQKYQEMMQKDLFEQEEHKKFLQRQEELKKIQREINKHEKILEMLYLKRIELTEY